jgi:hypothetical protein
MKRKKKDAITAVKALPSGTLTPRVDPATKAAIKREFSGLYPPSAAKLIQAAFAPAESIVLARVPGLRESGLVLPAGLTREEWLSIGVSIGRAHRRLHWVFGDWINGGKWGDKYTEAVRVTGFEEGTLRNIASVCARVQLSFRNDKLSFTHHIPIADLSPKDQKLWLSRAEKEGWSVATLRERLAEHRNELADLAEPNAGPPAPPAQAKSPGITEQMPLSGTDPRRPHRQPHPPEVDGEDFTPRDLDTLKRIVVLPAEVWQRALERADRDEKTLPQLVAIALEAYLGAEADPERSAIQSEDQPGGDPTFDPPAGEAPPLGFNNGTVWQTR